MMAVISAYLKTRQTKLFLLASLACFPGLDLNENLSRPLASIRAPQGHRCISHSEVTRRKPTATRISSVSMRKPHNEMGRALSQSLLCGADTASR